MIVNYTREGRTMKLKSLITLAAILLALPAMAFAMADLVVATDAPPKSMNPHALFF
jgi:hypothetical protein